MENDNHLPEMTEEKRKAALERSLAARRERMEFKDLVRKGELSLADALDDDRAKRIRVHEFLMCIPGIGKAKADEVMVAAVSGDPVAMQKVLAYFDGYMDQLCTHAFLDESGRVEYGVDTLRKTQLQGKLLAAMLRFEP